MPARLDYGNATHTASQARRLLPVLNAAARLIHRSSRYEHVTRYSARIDFKLAVLVYRCLHGLAPTVSCSTLRLHSACRRFQPSPSPVVVILAASDPTYTAFHCRWSCISGGWKPPLEQSAVRCHISSNVHRFPQSPEKRFSGPFPSSFQFQQFCTQYTVV